MRVPNSPETTPGLHVISGNRLLLLARNLADILGAPAADRDDCLRPDTVLVQSKGMQRWLCMTLADLNGICANLNFPFPNAFLRDLCNHVIGPLPQIDPFDPLPLALRVLHLLPDLLAQPGFEPLAAYLSDDGRSLKAYQLATKIADVMDQYLVFRPDRIARWEAGSIDQLAPAQRWQALLWKLLRGQIGIPHRADLQQRLIQRLSDPAFDPSGLPARLSVFGISHLPPFYIQVLSALAGRIPVFLFLLNPCRQYWSDILSDQQMSRIKAGRRGPVRSVQDLHLERGNRLLASWGQQGKEFFDFVHTAETFSTELFEENQDTLLGRVQQAILELTEEPEPGGRRLLEDGTVRVHACHSPMREVEVLHDQLLDIFDQHPDIQARDVLVMTPDISLYAPYIHAVFSSGPESGQGIAYSVADQTVRSESTTVQAFLQLLDLKTGRFEASRVKALLACPSICRRFRLAETDLPLVESWIDGANIRWGWNGSERKKMGLPGFAQNTWQAGLDRLLLGYAMMGDPQRLFAGIAPYDAVEGGNSRLLGNLIEFARALHDATRSIPDAAEPPQWPNVIGSLLDRFFSRDEQNDRDLHMIRSMLDHFQCSAANADLGQPVAFEMMRQYLEEGLSRTGYGTGFISGGVTFCAMLPMRSIPAKVICLLGLQHDAFPREVREPGFNLIAAEPRPGDRSKRKDDKYLFLETLISARRIFYISFIGQNIQDNSPIPPSGLVDELLEYLQEMYALPPDEIVVRHPLQSFSPAYYDGRDDHLFSYSKEGMEAARSLCASCVETPFFSAPISEAPDSWRHCRVDQLVRFFAHPARYLMEQRLGISFRETASPYDDREKFTLDALDRYSVGERLLESCLAGRSPEGTYARMRAAGDLPHGTIGQVLFRQLSHQVQSYARFLRAHLPNQTPCSRALDLDVGGFRLSGTIEGLYPDCHLSFRMAKVRPQDLIAAFIRHLLLGLMPENGTPKTTLLICSDVIWSFAPPLEPPSDSLKTYLDYYFQGLREPLRFFPKSSFAYAQNLLSKKASPKSSLAEAVKKWKGNDFAAGEGDDVYYDRCFGGCDPFAPPFEDTAVTIFGPVLSAGKQMAGGAV